MMTCDFEIEFDEVNMIASTCGKPANVAVYFPGLVVPELSFCSDHRPEVRPLCGD